MRKPPLFACVTLFLERMHTYSWCWNMIYTCATCASCFSYSTYYARIIFVLAFLAYRVRTPSAKVFLCSSCRLLCHPTGSFSDLRCFCDRCICYLGLWVVSHSGQTNSWPTKKRIYRSHRARSVKAAHRKKSPKIWQTAFFEEELLEQSTSDTRRRKQAPGLRHETSVSSPHFCGDLRHLSRSLLQILLNNVVEVWTDYSYPMFNLKVTKRGRNV